MVHEIIVVWFATVHTISIVSFLRSLKPLSLTLNQTITQALQDICIHQEYLQPLRSEVENRLEKDFSSLEDLPFLDSFIKESARTNCFERGRYLSFITQPRR